jgi:hypothetical protein
MCKWIDNKTHRRKKRYLLFGPFFNPFAVLGGAALCSGMGGGKRELVY